MPLLDGIQATKLIREFESSLSMPITFSQHIAAYGRVPIVAVSASLSEGRVHEYVEAGFDAWVLKPIDFKRLEAIITAIQNEQTREILLYSRGNWKKGGWFKMRKDDSSTF